MPGYRAAASLFVNAEWFQKNNPGLKAEWTLRIDHRARHI
jgi:hypothetical protein